MNESSIRCRRFDCSIRRHNHENDDVGIYLNLPITFKSNTNADYISFYKIIKYSKYDTRIICYVLRGILDKSPISIEHFIYIFKLLNTDSMNRFCKENPKFYNACLKQYSDISKISPLFSSVFPTFDVTGDYYEYIVLCYVNYNKKSKRKSVKFWNSFVNDVDDADNMFYEIVSFL